MLSERKLDYEGHTVFYRVAGAGIPLVFIHGFGEYGNVWTFSADEQNNSLTPLILGNEFLSAKFKFILPDLPGSGNSEMINDMTFEGISEVIKYIIDIESPQPPSSPKAVIIGHSMGGYVTLAFAEKYPNYLTGLGLFHSSSFPDTEEKKQARKRGIRFIEEHGAFEFLKTSTYNLFSQSSRETNPGLIDHFIGGLRNFSGDALVSYYEAMIRRPDRTYLLKNLKIPVLFIAGRNDNALPLNDVLRQCYLPEISYFHILAESGHMGMIEDPKNSNLILNEYLTNLS